MLESRKVYPVTNGQQVSRVATVIQGPFDLVKSLTPKEWLFGVACLAVIWLLVVGAGMFGK